MPKIHAYEDQVTAQGVLNGQADPNDFGASVGAGMQRLGGSLNDVSDAVYQNAERKEVTDTHVAFFEARDKWTQELENRKNNAIPGDDSFAEGIAKDIEDWSEKGAASVKTRKGQELYQSLSASLTSEFFQRAVQVQGNLAAADAKNKYVTVEKSAGSTVFNDHTQFDAVLEHGRALIDDPNGMFARVPATARDAFKDDFERSVMLAAAKGYVNKYPEATLKSMSPEDLAKFNPWKAILDANKAPGAKVEISSETLAKASEITTTSAAKGVNPNIVMAMMDLDGVEKKDQAGALSALVTKYGGDYSRALAAYDMGTTAFDAHMQRYGQDWEAQLPAPTHAYVNTVLVKSGSVVDPAAGPAAPEAPAAAGTPVASSLPFLKGLSWQEQDAIVKEGVQAVNLKLSMAMRARQEQEYELGKRQETVMDGMLKRIWDPKGNGAITEKDISNDTTLNPAQKQHLVDYRMTRSRALAAGAEGRSNPVGFKKLLLRVYAPEGDPNKIYTAEPIYRALSEGAINPNEFKTLLGDVTALKDGEGGNFQKSLYDAMEKIGNTFKKDIAASMPGGMMLAEDAAYRACFALRTKVAEYRKEGKNPQVLITPGTKEYNELMDPKALAQFMPSALTLLNQEAGKIVQQAKGDRAPAPGRVIGNTYKLKGKGNMVYIGGPENLSTSWRQ